MKLLVIGGTGVLSSAVVIEAINHNIDVTIVNRGRNGRSKPEGVHLIKADYHDETTMRTQLEGNHYDAVIDFLCYNQNQIEYSINLLHEVADQYIFISTTCVYNTAIHGKKKEDAEKALETWDYSINKWKCELLLQKKAKELNFNYTVIRPCITYDDTRIPYGIMPPYGYHWTFAARLINHKPILRWDGGKTRWNMMRVEDFAVGVVGLIGSDAAYGEAFNISGDNAYSWNDVISALEEKLGEKAIIFDITSSEYMQAYPTRKGEISGRALDAIVDNTKIKTVVPNFITNYDLKDGISRTVDAYISQNFQEGIDWKFDADTDRIITMFCKQKGIDVRQYNLSFVDYLGNATMNDKCSYWLEFNKDNLLVKFIRVLGSVIAKLR